MCAANGLDLYSLDCSRLAVDHCLASRHRSQKMKMAATIPQPDEYFPVLAGYFLA